MNVVAPQTPEIAANGEILFAGPELLRELLKEAERDKFLAVTVNRLGPAQRGRLALVIEDAIEATLAKRGACAPGIRASTDLDASLSDQLYRARLADHHGIALALPRLDSISNLGHALDSEDSAVLRWWIATTSDRPIRLYLDASDRSLLIYRPPVSLHEWLVSEISTATTKAQPRRAVTSSTPAPSSAPHAARPEGKEFKSDSVKVDLSDNQTPVAREANEESAVEPAATPAPPAAEAERPASVLQLVADTMPDIPESTPRAAPTQPKNSVTKSTEPATGGTPRDEVPPLVSPEPCEALFPDAGERWPGWLRDLETARGPKPLGAIERMFVSSYVPLRDARARGIAGAEADRALQAWARSFEQSYREAFDALRVRGKRPHMVLDAPEVAQRTGRLHGARYVQLFVVDGMRFDLGMRVEQRMKKQLGQNAALTERLLLWSALPTKTAVQLELLGKGPDSLKDFSGKAEPEITVARGRSAFTPRRIKVGSRELFKLDIAEWRLSEPGASETWRLDALADEITRVLTHHFARLSPRTLALVFGDHGFCLDPLENGTAAARQGGASPEEVLVPAMAWLVGSVH